MDNSTLKDRISTAIALLAVPGVGNGRFRALVQQFGSPKKVLEAPISSLSSVKGVSRSIASIIHESAVFGQAREIASQIIQRGWTVLFEGDEEYPDHLAATDDPPAILFRVGAAPEPDEHRIAIVGTRRATEKGRLFARQLGRQLAERGIVVVSGMAEGIDSEAHLGALEGGGRTYAVWGTSLEIVFPAVNRSLAGRIGETGAIYSEFLPGTHASANTFPRRNRIISGMSLGVVVVEAGQKSGALITASYAREQGREVFAVPGAPGSTMSQGTNQLIRQGARLITGIDDVLEELPTLKGPVLARKFKSSCNLTDAEEQLVELLTDGPRQVDRLARDAGVDMPGLMELLLALELKGVVRELAGKRFVLVDEAS